MKLTTLLTTALVLSVRAAPSLSPEADPTSGELVKKDTPEARPACNYAYNLRAPNHRGPGLLYTCRAAPFSLSSYDCYLGSGPTYCCSGILQAGGPGTKTGGCFPSP
ncbi:hypothetical protein PM082_006617 [Marasmius tenuissimus]|nr:hypothetical protein PM082_006617 [Marasmius tenuissimus]